MDQASDSSYSTESSSSKPAKRTKLDNFDDVDIINSNVESTSTTIETNLHDLTAGSDENIKISENHNIISGENENSSTSSTRTGIQTSSTLAIRQRNRIRKPASSSRRLRYARSSSSSSSDGEEILSTSNATSSMQNNGRSDASLGFMIDSEDVLSEIFESETSYSSADLLDLYDPNSTSLDSEIHSDGFTLPDTPKYNWNQQYEIMCRENGFSSRSGHHFRTRAFQNFEKKYYISRHTVEKMSLLHKLNGHNGCVNALNFNKSGNLLLSGSDDLIINVWNWASKTQIHSFKSGHLSNIFQAKFINLSHSINIVSSGRDGHVRFSTIYPNGQTASRLIMKHNGPVKKISISPQTPYEFLTASEDGYIVCCDLRTNILNYLTTVRSRNHKVPLYSVSYHPTSNEFSASGLDHCVHIYDKRFPKKPINLLCPQHIKDKPFTFSHVTCAVYNSDGSEILASYSNNSIFLFNTKNYINGSFEHRYTGHSNSKTIKGVAFFGPNSEYIISGSDCGNIFIWEKETEAIINWFKGDDTGSINCLESHTTFPILATSGHDHDVKIWMPLNQTYPPALKGLQTCIRDNMRRNDPEFNNFEERSFFFNLREFLRTQTEEDFGLNVEDLVDDLTSDDDSFLSSEGDAFEAVSCTPQ